jgi:hypothetical protein
MPIRTPYHELPAPQRAGILCNDPQFQEFAARRLGLGDTSVCPAAAAEYVRTCCAVTSRAHLETTPDAARKFAALQTEFDAWAGRIPPQR